MKKPKCGWCGSETEQTKVGEDWIGHIWHCGNGECAHEYVIIGSTKAGDQFWESFREYQKEFAKKKGKK